MAFLFPTIFNSPAISLRGALDWMTLISLGSFALFLVLPSNSTPIRDSLKLKHLLLLIPGLQGIWGIFHFLYPKTEWQVSSICLSMAATLLFFASGFFLIKSPGLLVRRLRPYCLSIGGFLALYGFINLFCHFHQTLFSFHPTFLMSMVFLGLAMIASRPDWRFWHLLMARGEGGSLLRHFVAASVIIPALLGMLYSAGSITIGAERVLNSVFFISAMIALFLGVIYIRALKIHALERERSRADLKLKQANERFQLAAQASHSIIYDYNCRTGHIDRSKGLIEVLGYEPENTPPTLDWWIEQVHPEDRSNLAFSTQGDFRQQYRIRKKSGEYIDVLDQGAVARDGEQKPVRIIGTVQDISRQVRNEEALKQAQNELRGYADELERRVADRTARLQETNAEMESFSYTVSHDLRAPLRAMQGFSQALLEDYSGHLDETGRDYLQRIHRASDRMDLLIHDLLQYSRVSRANMELEPVDIRQEIMALVHEIPENTANIILDWTASGPYVLAHSATLYQVLSNLLENAVKFVAPGVKPEVHFRVETTPQDVRLWVEDNGIGIDPIHFDRIFRVFERLHGTNSYPGTGIGLAIVKKGVERMGGSAGVESNAGQGSRFWIQLPATPVSAEVKPSEERPALHAESALENR